MLPPPWGMVALMLQLKRLEDYHRRRRRTAHRRRGYVPFREPLSCSEALLSAVTTVPSDQAPPAAVLFAVLPFLAGHLRSCWGVSGLLYRPVGSAVELHVVALRPMRGAVRQLTSQWLQQVRDQFPSLRWKLHVAPEPPAEEEPYRCVFWRRP